MLKNSFTILVPEIQIEQKLSFLKVRNRNAQFYDIASRHNSLRHWSLTYILSSVTRFGEISPLGQKITSLWEILEGLFLIWQNAEHTLENL